MTRNIEVEVIGVEPPCPRCQATKKAVDEAAEELRKAGISVKIKKLNILSKDVVSKYGFLVSPSVAVNGVVKVMGRVPSTEEIQRVIEDALK